MTLPITGEVYGLTHLHDQRNGRLIVLFWVPNQLGPVATNLWTSQGTWKVRVGTHDADGSYTWSSPETAFTGSIQRADLKLRADGVLEVWFSQNNVKRCRNLTESGTGTWS